MSLASRVALVLSAIAFTVACEEPAPAPQFPARSRPPVVAEAPSPAIVSPHLRRRDRSGDRPSAPARALGPGAGGGGGNVDWTPEPAPPPSQREVEAYRAALEREVEERVDATEDPCDQFRDVMAATVEATDRPGTEDPSMPSRRRMRENCRRMPEGYRQCLSPAYFREHPEECQAEMTRMAERGERRAAQARRQLEAIRRGDVPRRGQERTRGRDSGEDDG